jgi:hypothetical protein
MNIEKYFSDAFKINCKMTHHAILRITERFAYSELEKLKLLIQAGIRYKPLSTWKPNIEVVIIDCKTNISLLCVLRDESINIITMIHGKDSFPNIETIKVSILKEIADQGIDNMKRNLSKR